MSSAEQDANVIERDIRETQDQIGETVQKLEEQLAPRQVVRSVIGEDRIDWIEEALDLAKRNPVPVALIAVGTIWLLARSGSTGTDLFARLGGTRTAVDTAHPATAPASFPATHVPGRRPETIAR